MTGAQEVAYLLIFINMIDYYFYLSCGYRGLYLPMFSEFARAKSSHSVLMLSFIPEPEHDVKNMTIQILCTW